MRSIDHYAFRYCSGFTEIVFGSGMVNLYGSDYSGSCPFYKCSGIEAVTFLGEKVPVINSSLTATSSNGDCIKNFFCSDCFAKLKTIRVPAGCYKKYASAYGSYLQGADKDSGGRNRGLYHRERGADSIYRFG